ncbi:MAG TPA: sensor histidine kinase [Anaerolineae bacterium]|nr:sensor histidine kinase [Anaerolineae bacterium]
MSVLTQKLKDRLETESKSAELYHPYIFAIGGVGFLIALWAALTLGQIEHTRLLLQLFVLNVAAQLGIIAIRKTGTGFGVSPAINLATITAFGLQAGILLAFSSNIAVWLIMSLRGKQPIKRTIKTLVFNAGTEIIALLIAGFVLLNLRQWLQTSWVIFKPLDWFIAAVFNDQLNILLVAGLLFLQKGIHPKAFWRRNAWAMPINITIGALGGALLSAAITDMGLRGILIFMVPLVLSAYAFHIHAHSADQRLTTLRNRTSDLEIANQQLTRLSQHKEQQFVSATKTMQQSLDAVRDSVQMMISTQNHLPHERQMALLGTIATNEQTLRMLVTNPRSADSNPAQGEDIPHMRLFNLSELVSKVTAGFEGDSAEKQIRLRCHTGDVPIHIEADERMIQQVIQHLISNALKFTNAGGSVFVSLAVKNDSTTLSIEDTGFGIAKSEIASIFNPRYRSEKHATTTTGEGMGLAVVRRYVQAHNGTVNIESEVDLGTRFTITLPLHENILPTNADFADFVPSATIYTTDDYFTHARNAISI